MPSPRDFFENIVKPSYQEWLADPLTEWKAKAATSNADNLAERLYVHWNNVDQAKIANARSAAQYRDHLTANVCRDFGLVRDVHDGHKHMALNRSSRQVTSATQTGVAKMGWGEGGFGEGVFGGGDQIVVVLDDGSKRALTAVMQNVIETWEKVLVGMGL